jgi:hypothetical protein
VAQPRHLSTVSVRRGVVLILVFVWVGAFTYSEDVVEAVKDVTAAVGTARFPDWLWVWGPLAVDTVLILASWPLKRRIAASDGGQIALTQAPLAHSLRGCNRTELVGQRCQRTSRLARNPDVGGDFRISEISLSVGQDGSFTMGSPRAVRSEKLPFHWDRRLTVPREVARALRCRHGSVGRRPQ